MPDRRRRNRRRRTPIAGPTHDAGLTSGGGPAVAEPDPPSMGQVEFLDRAVRCYLRAGNLAEAAECLSQLGDHDQAAVLHLRLGDYPRAAGTYLKAGEPEAAAWVHVHYLGDPERAREILKHLSEPAPLATRPIGVSTRTESVESRLRVLQDRFRAVSASLQGPPPVPAALAGEPGTGSVAPAGLARSRIILVADYLAGASPSSIKPEARLEEIRTLKRAAVGQDDWPAGYAARELECLLVRERDLQAEDRAQAERRHQESLAQALSQHLVQARCDVADGAGLLRVGPVLAQTQALLAKSRTPCPQRIENWAVAIAEALRRYDQVALIFASSVRGRRPGAVLRWREWSVQVLQADATVLADSELR